MYMFYFRRYNIACNNMVEKDVRVQVKNIFIVLTWQLFYVPVTKTVTGAVFTLI